MSIAVAHTEEDHGHHHKETFVTKYIFSQDHKMISKQYLITGLCMGIIKRPTVCLADWCSCC